MLSSNDFKNLIDLAQPQGNVSIENLAVQVINLLLLLAGIIALIFLIYTGILYITSGNRPEQAQKAQASIINIIIGILIITISYVFIRFTSQLLVQVIK